MEPSFQSVSIVVPAAGKGVRIKSDTSKQYLEVAEKPILQHTLERLATLNPKSIVLVVAKDDDAWRSVKATEQCTIVVGGQTRADSVLNGLKAVEGNENDWVMVHDCVRPCVRPDDIQRLYDALANTVSGGLLAIPVSDTLKKVSASEVVSTVPRQDYWLAQTPQMFRLGLLTTALEQMKKNNEVFTDEAAAIESIGYKPKIVPGSPDNIKITTSEDLLLAEFYLKAQQGS